MLWFKKKKEAEEERKENLKTEHRRILKIERTERKQQNNIRISQFAAEQHIIINE